MFLILKSVYDGPPGNRLVQRRRPDSLRARRVLQYSRRDLLARILPGFDQETRDFYRWRVEYSPEELRDLIQSRLGIDLGSIRELAAACPRTVGQDLPSEDHRRERTTLSSARNWRFVARCRVRICTALRLSWIEDGAFRSARRRLGTRRWLMPDRRGGDGERGKGLQRKS